MNNKGVHRELESDNHRKLSAKSRSDEERQIEATRRGERVSRP
jgi:hypothetical protein